jgi:carbon-monoxide dehydrogenase large subunit
MYSQILADELGIGFDQVRVVFGDTDRVQRGAGSAGSRSARIGGGASVLAAREMVEKGRALAAEMMEAAIADIEFGDGAYRIAGTDRATTLFEVAARAEAEGQPLGADTVFDTEREAHANGCHIAEVEIDPELGRVSLKAHTVVADVGRLVNPMIVEGQMHGGAAQGIGQALLEEVVHDAASGQALSGSFMDYAMPRADDLPAMQVAFNEVLESDNPLGIKGAGESATTGAPAAIMNAVRDALGRAGAGDLDMPATPEAVWRALGRHPNARP